MPNSSNLDGMNFTQAVLAEEAFMYDRGDCT
jgi:hypothetical protein